MEKNGNYELLFIIHPDLESTIDKSIERIRANVEKRGGKVIYEENWGKRKLTYEINKTDVGIYVLWFLSLPKNKIANIEKDLRINEEVMRYMILKAEEKKEVKPKKEKNAISAEPTEKAPKKAAKKESDKERMEMIDKKIEALLGDEEEAKK